MRSIFTTSRCIHAWGNNYELRSRWRSLSVGRKRVAEQRNYQLRIGAK